MQVLLKGCVPIGYGIIYNNTFYYVLEDVKYSTMIPYDTDTIQNTFIHNKRMSSILEDN